MSFQCVREEAEKTMCELLFSMQTKVCLPSIALSDTGVPQHVQMSWLAETISAEFVQRSHKPRAAGVDVLEDLSDVLLIGGMTRMASIAETSSSISSAASPLYCNVNLDEAGAISTLQSDVSHSYSAGTHIK